MITVESKINKEKFKSDHLNSITTDVLLSDKQIISTYSALCLLNDATKNKGYMSFSLNELLMEFGVSGSASWKLLKSLQELRFVKKKRLGKTPKGSSSCVWLWISKRKPSLEMSYEALKLTSKYELN